MREMLKEGGRLVTTTFREFLEDDCMSMAAALAFYTMFSLPPLLVSVVTLVSWIFPFSREQVSAEAVRRIDALIGAETGEQIVTMLQHAGPSGPTTASTMMGIAILIFGATSVLAQLQYSLNIAWEVEPDPDKGGLKNFLFKRVISLAMLVAIAFLLMVSLVVSTALETFHDAMQQWFTGTIAGYLIRGADIGISFVAITFLFAAIYKVLPDARITWWDVSVGSAVSAFLFVVGKFLISFYLARSNIGSTYGAASVLAVILIWVYYASLIVFFGAEFAQVWARRYGSGLRPTRGAVRAVRQTELVHPGELLPPESKERREGKIIEEDNEEEEDG